MSQAAPSDSYRIYLLTVWNEDVEGAGATQRLRLRLEDPRTGERFGFNSSDRLNAFLMAVLKRQEDDT